MDDMPHPSLCTGEYCSDMSLVYDFPLLLRPAFPWSPDLLTIPVF